jgi:phage tail sheath protein FI
VTVSYPGVYVQEIPSTTHGVVPATTSATAFIGWFPRGSVKQAVHIDSLASFQRIYGGLDRNSEASYAIKQFFTNGGSDAWVVRVRSGSVEASTSIGIVPPTMASLSSNAIETLNTAWTKANAAWVEVFGTALPPGVYHPPASPVSPPANSPRNSPPVFMPSPPPIDLTSPPAEPSSPPIFTDPSPEVNLTRAAQMATDAANAAQFVALAITGDPATGSIGIAADANAIATIFSAQLAAANPALLNNTWRAAELAAAAALDAATAANNAAVAASTLAQMDAATIGQTAGMAAVQTAQQAAQAATLAAWTAASEAEAALVAASEAIEAADGPQLFVQAASPGAWGNCLQVVVVPSQRRIPGPPLFDLTVSEVVVVRSKPTVANRETYSALSLDPASSSYAVAVVNDQSSLIELSVKGIVVPGSTLDYATVTTTTPAVLSDGADGVQPRGADLDPTVVDAYDDPTWEQQLGNIAPNVFNLLCIPDTINLSNNEAFAIFTAANGFCDANHAFYLFDMPRGCTRDPGKAISYLGGGIGSEESYSSATYFPTLQLPDPLNGYRLREVGPSGTMAGVYARTDGQRGVWKAPAGVAAVLEGADVALKVTDADNGTLNSAGVNVLRTFPVYGPIAWGARTLAGADLLDSEWKYINVRRLVDYIEQSLVQSLKWVVFEPNDEATWGQIRLEVGSFLSGLFADGAFSGATPAAAYFVNCDATTTTADDIDRGIVNILVGVAPVKPAEFVVLQIEQIAAQAAG